VGFSRGQSFQYGPDREILFNILPCNRLDKCSFPGCDDYKTLFFEIPERLSEGGSAYTKLVLQFQFVQAVSTLQFSFKDGFGVLSFIEFYYFYGIRFTSVKTKIT